MASDLNLEITREENRVLVTWMDALNNRKSQESMKQKLLIVWVLIFLIVMFLSLSQNSVQPMFWCFLGLTGVFYIPEMLPKFVYIPRFVWIGPSSIKSGYSEIPLVKVTRVEYSRRGDWDGSEFEKNNRTQIRIWQDDVEFIIVGENDWNAEANHRVRNAIQKTIDEVRRPDKSLRTETQNKSPSDAFGIPVY